MSKTLTFKLTVNSVDDAGIVVVREETFAVSPETGSFIVGLPRHVSLALDYGNVSDKLLSEAIAKYEIACDAYSRERLGVKFENMLLLVFVNGASSVARQYGLDETLSIGLTPVAVLRVEGDNDIIRRRYDDGTIGSKIQVPLNLNRILLPDTPEIRAQYDILVTSIRKAGEILSGIDGADYFLKISHAGSEPVPAEPVASESSDPAQPQLPSNEPVPEDEEL